MFSSTFFEYGFDNIIIFKDFFKQYRLVFIINTPIALYLIYQFFKGKNKKAFSELFAFLFALSTFFYPYYNEKTEEIYSSINKLNNKKYLESTENMEDKERVIKILNKYHYYSSIIRPSNFDWDINFRFFNFSGINLVANLWDSKLYIPTTSFKANFTNANLGRVDFKHRSLSRSTFKNSTLSCVDFSHSELNQVDFSGIIIEYCGDFNDFLLNFEGANLEEANFVGLKIGNDNLLQFIKNTNFKQLINFTNVKNIESSCFDNGVKEKLISIFNIDVNEEKMKKYEVKICKKIRNN